MQFVAVATSFQIYYLSPFSPSVVKHTTDSAFFCVFVCFVAGFFIYFGVNSVRRFVALASAASL